MSFDAFRGIGNLPTRFAEARSRGVTHFMLTADELKAIEARITELSEIVTQSALTANDLPQAGWGPDPAVAVQQRLDELMAKINEMEER